MELGGFEPPTSWVRFGHDRGGGGKVDDYQHVLRMHPQTPVVHGCAGISGD